MKVFYALFLVTLIFTVPVFACDEHHDHGHEARIDHYQAKSIKSKEEAFKALSNNIGEVGAILDSEEISDSQLEQVHEISYTLEAAIDKLKAEKAGEKAQLETVDEAIQALHYASENHEEGKVRQWFAKLAPAAGNLQATPGQSQNAQNGSYNIVIKNNKFAPEEIRVPAGEKIKLVVDNQDPTPEEFESDDFRREKIIPGNSKATIYVGPLEPGKYHFFGEFNLDSANGYLIAE